MEARRKRPVNTAFTLIYFIEYIPSPIDRRINRVASEICKYKPPDAGV